MLPRADNPTPSSLLNLAPDGAQGAPGATSPTDSPRHTLIPLGALAAGFGLALSALPAQAQVATPAAPAASASEATLPQIRVKASAETSGKESYQSTTTGIGKGNQALRDVPQSVTVVTERLIDDRNLDTLKDALHSTAGITFMAAEGGEEDIRLRGFSLASTGDIFIDGLRDPAFYDRDTFNNDRIEVLRGSASMLFGRGSTGGVVNQVNKQPFLLNRNEVSVTAGTGNFLRLQADANLKTGENSALRVNGMVTAGDQAGLRTAKEGLAPAYRWGIGTANEFMASLYVLRNRNGINYGLPWLDRGLIPVATDAYYGAASDYNRGGATYGTLSHIHRFVGGGELKTVLRQGDYERDMRASAIRFCRQTVNANTGVVNNPDCPTDFASLATLSDATPLNRGTNNKVQDMQTRTLQSDFSGKFQALGMSHAVLTGGDLSQEDFANYNMTLPAGVTLDKNTPRTTIGTPNDGTSVDESLRIKTLGRSFEARALGLYVQDLVQVAPHWKLLAGLRWDKFEGRFWSAPTTSNAGVVTPATQRSRSDSLWSKRFGVLYQPTPLHSFHASYGTSFNTSGDTYQYDNQTENTGPERSGNFELGAKLDSASGDFTVRMALFHATKYNERNRDPDSAATQNLLSGKRHSAGLELDLSGRLTPAWEVFGTYAWTPIARIDVGAPGSTPGVGEGEGTRSSLTPKHSGSLWTTYQITPQWRLGGGLNARSAQTPNRNPGFAAPSFVTADLMAEYAPSDALSFKLNVNNATDKLYADALYTGHYIAGAPRSIQLTATAKF